ncbi:PREDICTED: cysteine-rich protein 2-binding protein isoform X1 [Polistes dominula]|uniref:Cysteine-rich protein 2-binding protein isoform X1 n=1 Tax=Polistes dominula TaxID=743375 RepID=A0ABM1J6L1_POLDO|nr:PREDICTED: cysteine-rich protein 2-binding protein isoform X1 [Polistes dominula]
MATVLKEEGIDEKQDNKFNEIVPDIDLCKKCGNQCNSYTKPALRCNGDCARKIHIECLQRGSVPVSFVGDVFFVLHCTECSPLGEETIIRDRMPWLNVIVLTLYNLREKSSGISKKGYFHWKSDISTFVDRNWDNLFKKNVKRKKNWIGTISGTLSHYSGIVFKSGTVELGESGWWRLIDSDPPEVLISKNGKMLMERKKQNGNQQKLSAKSYVSPTPSESGISLGEDSNYGTETIKTQGPSMYSQAYVQPTERLSDLLLEEDELSNMELEDDLILGDQQESPSLSELLTDYQYQNYNFNFPRQFSFDNFLSECSNKIETTEESTLDDVDHKIKREEEQFAEESNDSLSLAQEQPLPASLFEVTKRDKWPWQKSIVNNEKIPLMTHQEEAYLLQRVNKRYLYSAFPSTRRLYRKLYVRKLKREYGLPLLNIDHFGCKEEVSKRHFKKNDRVLDRFCGDNLGNVFEQRLQGHNKLTSIVSPYTNRVLKPFIRRDTSSRPLWLAVMEELCAKVNKNNSSWKPLPKASIDYSYIRPQHIPAINSLCNQFFWPDIDLTDCLQYPDFSCVVLYKKLVIGFAILVPDVNYNEAYISFLLTRPEWRKSGIATFMLYHLIQTCMGKDLTLHVSATNPALILYQKFGFKIEEFIQDFYDKYMPPNSRECRHALFLRLSR